MATVKINTCSAFVLSKHIYVHACHSMATYKLKVLKNITLHTIKTFGNYIGVILKQYTCTRVSFNGFTYKLKVLKTITLRTIKTFGNYIGDNLKQYTCTRVPHLQLSFRFHFLSVSIPTFCGPLLSIFWY